MPGSSTSRPHGVRPRCATARSSRGPGRACRSVCGQSEPAARSCAPPPDRRGLTPAIRARPDRLLAFGSEAYAAAFRHVRSAARAPPAICGCCMRARSTRRSLLPFNWFRKKQQDDEQRADTPAPSAPAPEPDPKPVAARPAAEAGSQAQRRRRGSRGGRGRTRKTPETQAAKVEKAEKKPEKKPAEKEKPERRPTAQKGRKQSSRRRAQPRRAPLPPAKRELLISVDVGEQRVAVLEDGVVAEVYLERPERRSIAGNIYKGVVDNVLPGMEAAFVEIGLEKNGFLYVDEIVGPELEGRKGARKIQDLIQKGQNVLVQAVKDPMKTKGARLTTEISLPGRFVVYVPHGEGLGVSRRLEDDER